MKNLSFKEISYDDIVEQEIDLVQWYYKKFIEFDTYDSKQQRAV